MSLSRARAANATGCIIYIKRHRLRGASSFALSPVYRAHHKIGDKRGARVAPLPRQSVSRPIKRLTSRAHLHISLSLCHLYDPYCAPLNNARFIYLYTHTPSYVRSNALLIPHSSVHPAVLSFTCARIAALFIVSIFLYYSTYTSTGGAVFTNIEFHLSIFS